MPALLTLRDLALDETDALRALAHSRTAEARLRDRARFCWLAHQGHAVHEISMLVGCGHRMVRRFNADGIAGLTYAAHAGRPATYTAEQIGTIVAISLIPPQGLGQPFRSWTLVRLVIYLTETHGITMRRSRLAEVLHAEGLR